MWLQHHDMMGVMGTWWKDIHSWRAASAVYGLVRKDRLGRWEEGFPFMWESSGMHVVSMGDSRMENMPVGSLWVSIRVKISMGDVCVCLSHTMWLTSRWGIFQTEEETWHPQALVYMENFNNPVSEGTTQKDTSNPWGFKEGVDKSSPHTRVGILWGKGSLLNLRLADKELIRDLKFGGSLGWDCLATNRECRGNLYTCIYVHK